MLVDEELDMPSQVNALTRNSLCPGLMPMAWIAGERGFLLLCSALGRLEMCVQL